MPSKAGLYNLYIDGQLVAKETADRAARIIGVSPEYVRKAAYTKKITNGYAVRRSEEFVEKNDESFTEYFTREWNVARKRVAAGLRR